MVGIEVFGFELRNKVFVSEARLRTVSRDVVFEILAVLLVHLARIPLIAERGHGVHTPMDEDAELGVAIPLWHFVMLDRSPRRLERSPGDDGVDFAHGTVHALLITLSAGESAAGQKQRQQSCEPRPATRPRHFYPSNITPKPIHRQSLQSISRKLIVHDSHSPKPGVIISPNMQTSLLASALLTVLPFTALAQVPSYE